MKHKQVTMKQEQICYPACINLAKALKEIISWNIEVGIVIGGGNICRGINLKKEGMSRTPSDHIGMLATLMNGISIKEALAKVDVKATVYSSFRCPLVAEEFVLSQVEETLASKQVAIFAGGVGAPYFTTDTAAALRANEIKADLLLKATKVDGVYDKDPKICKDAKKYDKLNYSQLLEDNLKIMDLTAITLCQEEGMPIFVFNMQKLVAENLSREIFENRHGTIIQ